jgi:hypothetical protein
MDEHERAKLIARIIEDALQRSEDLSSVAAPTAPGPAGDALALPARFTVEKQQGCLACDPGACWECGYLFSGERIIIRHVEKGERVLSDRALHLLMHGIVRYQTKYVIRGEPVIVDLDLDELAGYLDL